MNTLAKALLVCSAILFSKSLSAQDTLLLLPDIIYTDSLSVNSDTILLNVQLVNKGTVPCTDILVLADQDSAQIILMQEGASTSILPNDTLKRIITIVYSSLADFSTKKKVVFTASTRTAGFVGSQVIQDIFIEKQLNEEPFLTVERNIKIDSLRFNQYYPLSIELSNTGKVDYNNYSPISLRYSINNEPQSETTFYTGTNNLLANKRNTVLVEDSILVTSQYFKKGGGNIVVVWPVGFLRIDSTADTIVVNWPVSVNSIYATDKEFFFPNPASTYVESYNLKENTERVRIFDYSGKQYECKVIDNKIWINNLAPGTYIVECTLKNKIIRQKLIVKN